MQKSWLKRVRADGAPIPLNFGNKTGISSLCAEILWNRGFSTEEEIERFLAPHLRFLEQPHQWPNVQKAANLLVDNILQGKKLAVWGDYDVDGITGVCIVLEVFNYYNIYPLWHIPERFTQGYGLNEKYIEKLANEGAQILLTVDCGISDFHQVDKAHDLNMVVIISDHHVSPDNLPNADAICSPHLANCPCNNLAGVGMAFFLMAEVNKILSETLKIAKFDMRQCLDLVALGSLADMVPLEGQNRILVKNGLLKIQSCERIGLAALKSVSNLHINQNLSARQIVFSLAPRINAAGRMADPKIGVELFTSQKKDEALQLAIKLDEHNEKRKLLEKSTTEEAILQAEEQVNESVIFVRNENWSQGIVGIVASRLVEIYAKPAFVFGLEGEYWKASARSIQNFDLHEGLTFCSEYLESFGGHAMAAGLKVHNDIFNNFTTAFINYFNSLPLEQRIGKKLYIDGELDFKTALDYHFRSDIQKMQPFGVGNEEPFFVSPPLKVTSHTNFGALKQHVKLSLKDEQSQITLPIKVWQQAKNYPKEMLNKNIHILYSLKFENTDFANTEHIKVKDWEYVSNHFPPS